MRLNQIAVISYHTCPLSDEKDAEIGGMNTYVLELSKALAEKGILVDIYTRSTSPKSKQIIKVTPNLRVIHLSAGKSQEIPKKELHKFCSEFANNLGEFIRKEKISYDLINAHYYLSGLIGLRIKEKLKIPLVITFHTLALMKNLVAKNDSEMENSFRVESELMLIKRADKIIATSDSDFEYIHNLYNCPSEKIEVLTPGVDLKLFKPIDKTIAKKAINADPTHKLALFVGRIEPLKGIDVLLYAMKILVQKCPKIPLCLWIVGGGSDRKKVSLESKRLNKIRKLLNMSSYVKFVGKKERSELPYYYNSAELVLMPSSYESFGITALEAMACGVPVITTDVTGISGLLDKKHSSLLTSASNPIGLAKKMCNLLLDDIEHKKMSKEVFSKVQDLSWESVADKFIRSMVF